MNLSNYMFKSLRQTTLPTYTHPYIPHQKPLQPVNLKSLFYRIDLKLQRHQAHRCELGHCSCSTSPTGNAYPNQTDLDRGICLSLCLHKIRFDGHM